MNSRAMRFRARHRYCRSWRARLRGDQRRRNHRNSWQRPGRWAPRDGGRAPARPAPPRPASRCSSATRTPRATVTSSQPTLTKAAAATMAATPGFTANFTGHDVRVAAVPGERAGRQGRLLRGHDRQRRLRAGRDHRRDRSGCTTSAARRSDSGAGCGSIHPIGIMSTPVIDAASRTIFVAGAIGTATISRHEVHALSVDDGTEKTGWPVDVSTVPASGGTTFMPQPANQRSALSLVGGDALRRVRRPRRRLRPVPRLGHRHQRRQPDHEAAAGRRAGRARGSGRPAGMASDGNGVFASTGNRTGGGGPRTRTARRSSASPASARARDDVLSRRAGRRWTRPTPTWRP